MGSWFADWKNLTIAALAVAVIILSSVLLTGRHSEEDKTGKGKPTKETASVLDISFDRENQRGAEHCLRSPVRGRTHR